MYLRKLLASNRNIGFILSFPLFFKKNQQQQKKPRMYSTLRNRIYLHAKDRTSAL